MTDLLHSSYKERSWNVPQEQALFFSKKPFDIMNLSSVLSLLHIFDIK
jgi:hypothetical protein